jgi:hypothetical protein
MMMGSYLCLPARGAVVISTSLLCFLSLPTDKCTGNGGPGLIEYGTTMGRLGLGLLALRAKPWVRVHYWHATTTINSSLALGDDRFGPKGLTECSIALILGTMAATLWSTVLACNVGGRKIPAKRQGTDGWALPRACAWLPAKYPLGIHVQNQVFLDKEGYPHFV